MKKKYILPAIIIFAIINLFATCGGDDDKPDYYFKCVVNGVFKDYSVNSAYYDASKDLTILTGRSALHGEIEVVWKGMKISSGEVVVSETSSSSNTPHIWLTDEVAALDTFKSTNYKYKLLKYQDVSGKIVGEFSAEIFVNKLAYLKDTTRIDSLVFSFVDGYFYINSQITNFTVDTLYGAHDTLIGFHNDTIFVDSIDINVLPNLLYIEDTVSYQIVKYRQVPEFLINVAKGEFSFYRSMYP